MLLIAAAAAALALCSVRSEVQDHDVQHADGLAQIAAQAGRTIREEGFESLQRIGRHPLVRRAEAVPAGSGVPKWAQEGAVGQAGGVWQGQRVTVYVRLHDHHQAFVSSGPFLARLGAILVGGMAVVGLIVAWAIHLQILKPLARIEGVIGRRTLRSDDLVEVARRDEIGRVAEGLNALLRTVVDQDARLRALVQQLPAVAYSRTGKVFQFVSEAIRDLTGRPAEDWLGGELDFDAGIASEDRQSVAAARSLENYEVEYRYVDSDGRLHWVLERGRREPQSDRIDGFLLDVTDRREALAEAASSRRRLDTLFETASDVILVIDAHGTIEEANPATSTVFGYPPEELIGQNVKVLMPSPVREHHDAYLARTRAVGKAVILGEERRLSALHRDGHEVPIEIAISQMIVDGQVKFTGILRDITHRRRAEAEIERAAYYDAVCDLPNRRLFLDRTTQAIARAKRTGESVAVMLIDLDNFKLINDTYGHSAGDQVLVEVARRLKSGLREADTVARLGGDEFTVLLGDADTAAAQEAAARLVEALSAPITLPGVEVVPGASFGIAVDRSGRSDAETLLRDADTAMYRAKERGKGGFVVFDASMNEALVERLKTENDLRRGIDDGQLRVYYQPLVGLQDGRIRGAEALVRWEHPEHGLVSPARFVPLAEDLGLIVPIGKWVLEESCRQAALWRNQYPWAEGFCIGVNVAARQLESDDIVEVVFSALEASGLPPKNLKIEVTETVMVQNRRLVAGQLEQLRKHGVKVAVDDFGTGYSSLATLMHLPIDNVKIDKSFVDPIGNGIEPTAILRAIITLCHVLDLEVTAEGLESEHQVTHLQSLGCHLGQGYYFAKPLEAERLEEAIALGGLRACLTGLAAA